MDVLERIETFRKERGWSVNNLAMEAMLTQSTLNNLYSRKTEPKLSTLRSICGAFGITLAEFFSEDNALPEREELDLRLYRAVAKLSGEQKDALLTLLKSFGK